MTNPKLPVLNLEKESIHDILAQSYVFFFLGLVLGLLLDLIWPFRIIPKYILMPVGLTFLVFGPIFIFWAQYSSRQFKKTKNVPILNFEDFKKGPYAFTRSPTHAGMAMLLLGFGFIANSIYIIIFSIAASIISRRFFLKKEEKILEQKYGAEYQKYKKSVLTWF